MKKLFVLLAGAVMASAAAGHHSAAQFDFVNTELVTGEVVDARFANPHMRLVLKVADEDGDTREIEYEGHSRNNMQRQGFKPNMFSEGDTITIRIAPMRGDRDGGYITALRTPEGTEIGNVTGAD